MSFLDRLTSDMKEAMKSKDKTRLSVIRMVKAAMQNEAIHQGVDRLSEDGELTVLNRELKQRKDSLREFENANRQDLVEKVQEEIAVLQDYMPEQMSNEELEQLIQQVIGEVGASSKQDMGKVMSAIMPKVKGKADGSLVNQLVAKHLA